MKRALDRCRALLFGTLLFFFLHSLHAVDAVGELEAFRKKVDESTSTPFAQSQFTQQIKRLENLLKRDEPIPALQALENLTSYEVPRQFEEEWARIVDLLGKELQTRKNGQLEKWTATIEQLVKDTQKTCLEAKISDDLDPLLVRCSAVQMQADRGHNVMTERLNQKLQGVAQTLSAWSSYLDYRKAGNDKRANDALRGLISNNSGFPILGVKEIESRMVEGADTQMDIRTLFDRVFAGIKSPDDLPTALERLQSYSSNPSKPQAFQLGIEVTHLTAYIDAWKFVQAGDTTSALASLSRSFGGYEDAQRYYAPIKAEIEARILKDKVRLCSKLTQNPDEPSRVFLGRVLDDLKQRSEYAAILELMNLAIQLDRSSGSPFSLADRQAIEQYIAAQRFEKAGDALAAVTSYRLAISVSASKYAPANEAQDALRELQTKHPEAFKSYEGVLLEQMRALSQQLQILQNRPYPMGGPYRPQ